MKFYETSAKTSDNVNVAFSDLSQWILEDKIKEEQDFSFETGLSDYEQKDNGLSLKKSKNKQNSCTLC